MPSIHRRYPEFAQPAMTFSISPSLTFLAFVALAPFAQQSVATTALPDLGDVSEATLSRPAAKILGRQAIMELRASGAYLDDPEVNDYLNRLGHRLVAADTSIRDPFDFFAVPASDINAFALPGGFIGVNSGLIEAADSEGELASVLAHEISHVTQNHIARAAAKRSGAELAPLAALAAVILAGRSGNGQIAAGALNAAVAAQEQSRINFTREHEQEADRIGFRLLVAAGFEPTAMATFFAKMQRITRISESDTPGYLRDHPLTQQRVGEAQERALHFSYRQIADGEDFFYVRALLRSYDGTAADAVLRLGAELESGRYRHRHAARYGYAAALLRAKDHASARHQIDLLDRDRVEHPMIESIACQVLQQSGDFPAAIARYKAAIERYPNYAQLIHDYPRTELLARNFSIAAEFAETRLAEHRDDAELQQIAAEANAALGRKTRSHYHQGEYYAAMGGSDQASEQFELALRSGDGTETDLVIVENRLRELRQRKSGASEPERIGPRDGAAFGAAR